MRLIRFQAEEETSHFEAGRFSLFKGTFKVLPSSRVWGVMGAFKLRRFRVKVFGVL